MSRGSPTISPTVWRGSSEAKGSWKMIASSLRMRRSEGPDSRSRGSPLKTISPSLGSTSRRIERPRVDLPQPDSPTSPSVSPCLIVRSMPSTARTWPTVRFQTPLWMGNQVLSPRTSRRGSEAVQTVCSGGRATDSGKGSLQVVEVRSILCHPAGGSLPVPERLQRRHLVVAAVDGEGAAWVERAAVGKLDQVRWHALDGPERRPVVRGQAGQRPQQRPRVWV